MKRTKIARAVRDEIHEVEASLDATLAEAMRFLENLREAREGLGCTGTMGLTAIAKVEAAVEALHDARSTLIEGHIECYQVLKALRIPAVADNQTIWPRIVEPAAAKRA